MLSSQFCECVLHGLEEEGGVVRLKYEGGPESDGHVSCTTSIEPCVRTGRMRVTERERESGREGRREGGRVRLRQICSHVKSY